MIGVVYYKENYDFFKEDFRLLFDFVYFEVNQEMKIEFYLFIKIIDVFFRYVREFFKNFKVLDIKFVMQFL